MCKIVYRVFPKWSGGRIFIGFYIDLVVMHS
jgi:hypothetical protein